MPDLIKVPLMDTAVFTCEVVVEEEFEYVLKANSVL
jgi:hypothetical protein